MIELVKNLCAIDGTSGNEDNVRNYISEKLDALGVEYKIDNLGNILGKKTGKYKSDENIMLAAHMDEVGMMITSICDDGSLKFGTVGGISSDALIGKTVRINGICGVIGSKAVHNMTASEKSASINADSLYIDIGAQTKENANQLVNLGDCAYFDSNVTDFGDNLLIGKAIDDRAGCAIILKLIEKSDYSFSFAFTVQEEVGTRGAGVAAYTINPDIAIVLEATTAADIPSASGANRVCEVNKGAVISFMDRSTIYDKGLYNTALEISKQQGIKCQVKSRIAGGNDSGAIHKAAGGVKCLAISVPCRYLHSGVCVSSVDDIYSSYELCNAMLKALSE